MDNPVTILFDALTAYQRTGALKAAVELDLFTAVAEGRDTVASLARHLKASERGVRGLCDALAAVGFLDKRDGRYALAADFAPFLDQRSPVCIAGAIHFLGNPRLLGAFADLAAAVRKGGTVLDGQGSIEPENPLWVEFARAMAPIAGLVAQGVAGALGAEAGEPWKVLDVAAGHGLYGITIAERNPHAEITALDWASVLAVAQENARAAGVVRRFRTLPGSAFDVDWGRGYDLVLLTNFLHHFDPPTCEAIFARAHAALRPGGRAVTVEFVPDEGRTTPPAAATFTLVMLATTPAGDVYTFAEYERMARAAGFARSELREIGSPQRAIFSYRD